MGIPTTSRSTSERAGRGQRGFSFFGVLLIVFTMSCATALLFVPLLPSQTTRQIEITQARGAALKAAVIKYKSHHAGAAPSSLDELVVPTGPACAMDTDPASPSYRSLLGWCGPYIDRRVEQETNAYKTDGWGTAFDSTGSVLRSCGPDKTCGNGDDLAFTDL